MKNRGMLWQLSIHIILAFIVFTLGACAGNAAPAGDDTTDGAALLQASCTQCHGLDRVTSKAYDAARWEQVVNNMIQRGAKVSDTQALVDHLAMTYGP